MKGKILFLLGIVITLIFIFNLEIIKMKKEPTLEFKIAESVYVDKDMSVNIRFINDLSHKNAYENKMITLLHTGVKYPMNNKKDYMLYEIFIKKGDKFFYTRGENVFFQDDPSSIRAGSGRTGEIYIIPFVQNGSITLEEFSYYKGKSIKRVKNIEQSDSFQFDSKYFNEKTTLDDFTYTNFLR